MQFSETIGFCFDSVLEWYCFQTTSMLYIVLISYIIISFSGLKVWKLRLYIHLNANI